MQRDAGSPQCQVEPCGQLTQEGKVLGGGVGETHGAPRLGKRPLTLEPLATYVQIGPALTQLGPEMGKSWGPLQQPGSLPTKPPCSAHDWS